MRNHHRTTTTKPWHSTQFQDTYYPLTTTQYEPNIKSDEPLIVHIKSVLNVKNSTIDKHLLNFFNIDNPDPLYIFVLPDATKNRTVVLRKSNFSPATFPNISILDKRIQSHSSTFKSLPQSQLLPAESKRIQRSKLLLDDSSSVENDASTEDEQNVVAENVRTEKNFFKFMDRLNNGRLSNDVEDQPTAAALQQIQGDHLYEIDDVLPSGYRFPLENPGDSFYHRQKYPKRSTKISWKDLGLNGWSGRLSKPGIRYRKGKRSNDFKSKFLNNCTIVLISVVFFTVWRLRNNMNFQRQTMHTKRQPEINSFFTQKFQIDVRKSHGICTQHLIIVQTNNMTKLMPVRIHHCRNDRKWSGFHRSQYHRQHRYRPRHTWIRGKLN